MEYNGKDLILAMGAPGSRWSGSIRLLSLMHEEINCSDETEDTEYNGPSRGRQRMKYWLAQRCILGTLSYIWTKF